MRPRIRRGERSVCAQLSSTTAKPCSSWLLRSASCRPSAPACEAKSAERNWATLWGRSCGCICSAQSMAARNSWLKRPRPRASAVGIASGSSSRDGASRGLRPLTSQKSVAPIE